MLKRFATAVFTLLCIGLQPAQAGAQNAIALSSAAAKAGLTYAWIPAAGAAQLTAPGLTIVVRPGERLYEVNDRVEVSDREPRATAAGELYVSRAFAHRIASLAQGRRTEAADGSVGHIIIGQASSAGPLTISMRPVQGRDAIVVDGNASPNALVTVAVIAQFSHDIPDVSVVRQTVQADASGRFSTTLPLAGDYVQGTAIRVTAYSGGLASPTLTALIGPPNPGVNTEFDRLPHDRP